MPPFVAADSPLARVRAREITAPAQAAAPTLRRGGASMTALPAGDTDPQVSAAAVAGARAAIRRAARAGTTGRVRRDLRPDQLATLRRLLCEKYEFVHHPLFELDEDEAYDEVFVKPDPLPLPNVDWYVGLMDPATAGATGFQPPRSSGSVLLTAAQERVLFSQYNYCRREVCRRRDALGPGADAYRVQRQPEAREMLDWHARADNLRTQVANTNLALVLAMAKRVRIHSGDFPDLISEGNMALLRAADKFDVSRGFKFSTYACRAILKAFSRQGIKMTKHRQMFPVDFDPKFERSNHQAEKNAEHEGDCVEEVGRIVNENLADLSDVELKVVAARFNVGPDAAERRAAGNLRPLTLDQVGKLVGVTKERVRQIQTQAMEKIRETLEEDFLR